MLNPAKTDNKMFLVFILLFYVNGYLLLDV